MSNEEKRKKGREGMKRYRDRRKTLIYDYYGRRCNCCGETNMFFLTIDHVNNDGFRERKYKKDTGYARQSVETTYRKIINENFPSDFQILCYNCNIGKYRNGGTCPHQNYE